MIAQTQKTGREGAGSREVRFTPMSRHRAFDRLRVA
jgi:hypothetical protein